MGSTGTREYVAERVFVDSISGCWEWRLCKDRDGYGRALGKAAHRVSYEIHVGPIPEGLVIDHLCRNRGCVNPAHMEPVTNAVNASRGELGRPRQERCKRGHPLSGENALVAQRGKYTVRTCRACQSLHQAAYRQRRQEAAKSPRRR